MINVKNVSKFYGNENGIHDLSFHFQKGNVYGLIGPNGAGKTTLIKMMTNFIKIDRGSITKNFKNNERLFNLSYMPDFETFVPGTVQKNIDFYNLTYQDINMDVITNILQKFDISVTEKVKNLSTGKRKALRFALCVCRKVDVYIFDEPFSGIDVITRKLIV